jgi:hypothetical protein
MGDDEAPAAEDELLPWEVRVAKRRAGQARKEARDTASRRAKRAALVAAEIDAPEIFEPEAPAPQQTSSNGQMRMAPDGAVLSRFMQDWNFVTAIMGPWGSGKSVGCVGKMYSAACLQFPARDGVRRTRWLVVRDSYPNLQETTIKTWLDWFPETVYGDMRKSRPMQHVIRVPGAPVGGRPTTVEMEVLFLALENEEDRKKLLSMELTGAWINEAREIRKAIIDDVIGRTGRYPSMRDGGATWAGVFMDTNAPSETHWLPVMMGLVPAPEDMPEDDREALKKPDNWSFYQQPGALVEIKAGDGRVTAYEANPLAENIRYLRGGHQWYLERVGGKPRSWVRVNFCNKLGEIVAGKPVWPNFAREKHVATADVPVDPGLLLHVGIDSTGRNPAAVFAQVYQNRWRIVGELVVRDVNVETFAPMVRRKIGDLLRPSGRTLDQVTCAFYRDPHSQRSDIDDETVDRVFQKHGIRLIPAPGGNTIKHRLDTAEVIIDTFRVVISPSCRMLVSACDGAYRYRRLQVSGREEYSPEPEKNAASNVADALQYLFLGAGEGRDLMKGGAPPKPINTLRKFNPLSRGPVEKPRFALLGRR